MSSNRKPPSKKVKGSLYKSNHNSISKSKNEYFGVKFEIDHQRFNIMKFLGKGAFGTVVSAHDNETNEVIAIKKIPNIFSSLTAARRVLRELRLLRLLNHENIIPIKTIPLPSNPTSFDSIYLCTEYMETDLHSVIQSSQPLNDRYITFFIWQLLKGVDYLHHINVIHRDLKPTNILLKKNCDLKICDFGLARVDKEISLPFSSNPVSDVGIGSNVFMTEHVVTRWYRSPEVILSWGRYTKSIDMWSIGCILAELLGRKPLFAGQNYIEQLELINNIIGKPTDEVINLFENKKARHFMKNLPNCAPTSLSMLFPNASELSLDLLSRLLVFDPRNRITAVEALQHPYLQHLSQNSFNDFKDSNRLYFDFEDRDLSENELRRLIYEEILNFHPALQNYYLMNQDFSHLGLSSSETSLYIPAHRSQSHKDENQKSIVSAEDEESDLNSTNQTLATDSSSSSLTPKSVKPPLPHHQSKNKHGNSPYPYSYQYYYNMTYHPKQSYPKEEKESKKRIVSQKSKIHNLHKQLIKSNDQALHSSILKKRSSSVPRSTTTIKNSSNNINNQQIIGQKVTDNNILHNLSQIKLPQLYQHKYKFRNNSR